VGTWTEGAKAVSIDFVWTYTAESVGDTDPALPGETRAPIGKAISLHVGAERVDGGLRAESAPPMAGLAQWKRVRTEDTMREVATVLFARR
jgi:hypothetical protein